MYGGTTQYFKVKQNHMELNYSIRKEGNSFLARLYESTGRAIAITPASASALALASALLKMLKFLVKVFIRLYLLNMLMN